MSGSHWFRQKVNVSAEQAGKDAVLRLGCMVDADSVFVNGTFVGNTFYQYPHVFIGCGFFIETR